VAARSGTFILSLAAMALSVAIGPAQAVPPGADSNPATSPARTAAVAHHAGGGSSAPPSATFPARPAVLAQLEQRGGGSWERRPFISPYRTGVYAGAAEAGAMIGADAVADALDRPPPPDPACSFPSQSMGQMSAGIPPCNVCEEPPCN
jgi:hypothetical protein